MVEPALKNPGAEQYTFLAKVLHWAIVALLIVQYLLGFVLRNQVLARMLPDDQIYATPTVVKVAKLIQ